MFMSLLIQEQNQGSSSSSYILPHGESIHVSKQVLKRGVLDQFLLIKFLHASSETNQY